MDGAKIGFVLCLVVVGQIEFAGLDNNVFCVSVYFRKPVIVNIARGEYWGRPVVANWIHS